MKSKLLTTGLAVLALAAVPATASAAPAGTDSASGHGSFGSQEIRFSAKSTATGFNAQGSVRLTITSSDPNQVIEGEVTCLRVTGATATTPATATIGAVVTKAPPGSFASSIIIHASDSGKFANTPDTLTFFQSSSPPPPDGGCPTSTFFGGPLADGEVVIQNALP